MKKITDWNRDIIKITKKIHQEFPELSKYITEMPVKLTEKDKDVINIKNLEEYYNSLEELLNEYSKTHADSEDGEKQKELDLPGYPLYPPTDDIYNKGKKEMKLNPEDLSKNKTANELESTPNEKGFEENMSGDNLDVPGAELDDQQESVGSEDEENNYYSLGGDNHENLEEDKG